MSSADHVRRLTWWVIGMPAWPTPAEYPNRDYLEVVREHMMDLDEWDRRKPKEDEDE